MKLTSLTKKQLVDMVARQIAESIVDDDADDLRQYVMDLEAGKIRPTCAQSRRELLNDIVDLHTAACLECDAELTIETAYVTDDNDRDLVCKLHS